MLGSIPGVVSTGELETIWQYGFKDDKRCACGKNFSQCPFWRDVATAAFGGASPGQTENFLRLKQSFRVRHIWKFALRRAFGRMPPDSVSTYVSHWEKLLRSVSARSGSSVLVDSSKSPHVPYCLGDSGQIQFAIIHLVRDSRAVAYSYGRKKEAKDGGSYRRYIKRSGILYSSFAWMSWNLLVHLLLRRGRYVRIRYEDLVSSPASEIRKIMALVDKNDAALPFLSPAGVELPDGHLLGGNPMRFQIGVVPLELDEEWRRGMGIFKKLAVTIVTFPLLLAYGYGISWRR